MTAIRPGDARELPFLRRGPARPARGLYEAAGFRRVGESGTSWTLALARGPAAVPRG